MKKMKKLVLLFLGCVLFTSCSDKKKENTPEKEEVKYKYALVLDAVYEKDDSISVVYQIDNYYKYDKPVGLKIKGSPLMQRLMVDLPQGEAIENISFVISTNKDQPYVTMKNISVKNDTITVFNGDNYKFTQCFLTDTSFGWDAKNSRYTLVHTNKYPPTMVGNENLKSLMMK